METFSYNRWNLVRTKAISELNHLIINTKLNLKQNILIAFLIYNCSDFPF